MDEATLKRLRKQYKRFNAYMGMIAEVKSKARIYRDRVQQAIRDDNYTPEDVEQYQTAVFQMQEDLAKYTRRMKKIYEEFEGYGLFQDVE